MIYSLIPNFPSWLNGDVLPLIKTTLESTKTNNKRRGRILYSIWSLTPDDLLKGTKNIWDIFLIFFWFCLLFLLSLLVFSNVHLTCFEHCCLVLSLCPWIIKHFFIRVSHFCWSSVMFHLTCFFHFYRICWMKFPCMLLPLELSGYLSEFGAGSLTNYDFLLGYRLLQ